MFQYSNLIYCSTNCFSKFECLRIIYTYIRTCLHTKLKNNKVLQNTMKDIYIYFNRVLPVSDHKEKKKILAVKKKRKD